MKLKLKVPKQLKRTFKERAEKVEMIRVDFVLDLLKKHVDAVSPIDQQKVDEYKLFLEKRTLVLEEIKERHLTDEQLEEALLTEEDKRAEMKTYYKEYHVYRPLNSKNKKAENIIVAVPEEYFYTLCMLADEEKLTVENYVEKILHFLK